MYQLSLPSALGSIFFSVMLHQTLRHRLSVPINLFEIPGDESQLSSFVCEFHVRMFPNCAFKQPRVESIRREAALISPGRRDCYCRRAFQSCGRPQQAHASTGGGGRTVEELKQSVRKQINLT